MKRTRKSRSRSDSTSDAAVASSGTVLKLMKPSRASGLTSEHLKLGFDGPNEYHWGSVAEKNKGEIPWLFGPKDKLFAGAQVKAFIKYVMRNGGKVYGEIDRDKFLKGE